MTRSRRQASSRDRSTCGRSVGGALSGSPWASLPGAPVGPVGKNHMLVVHVVQSPGPQQELVLVAVEHEVLDHRGVPTAPPLGQPIDRLRVCLRVCRTEDRDANPGAPGANFGAATDGRTDRSPRPSRARHHSAGGWFQRPSGRARACARGTRSAWESNWEAPRPFGGGDAVDTETPS